MELELEDNLKAHVASSRTGHMKSRIAEENFRSAPRGHSARWQSMLRKRGAEEKQQDEQARVFIPIESEN